MKTDTIQLLLYKVGNSYIKNDKKDFATLLSIYFTNCNVEERKIRASALYEVIKGLETTKENK